MSRIGKKPVIIPKGVTVDLKDSVITAKGAKGELSVDIHPFMDVKIEDGQILVSRSSDEKFHRSLHGLTRALINNIVVGVSEGFKRELEIIGTGYSAKANKGGKELELKLGFSHPVNYPAPEGIDFETPSGTQIVVSGADKQKVGQTAAEIRGYRPPEPYHGKGVRYKDELVRRKAGKAGA